MDKKWYIVEYEQKTYLRNKTLLFKQFKAIGDHRHCELCWNRISNANEDLHCGYYEEISGSWICEACFNDFRELFHWNVDLNN